ncbi:hypothetical protein [Pseudomonas sp. CAM1A]|uniref:hypothetical protein n=1 Tax=Pseudomonas sp. CAM1A TaxID=3231717 RepID=UPI0039C5AC8B
MLVRTLAVSSLLFLAGCAQSPSTPDAAAQPHAKAIEAFAAVCLKTAPSFDGAAEAATRAGIVELQDMGFMRMGFSADKSLAVQLSAKECVITTPNQQDDSLTGQLLAAAKPYSQSPLAASVPTKLRIQGETFILHHDRKGGEAYVLMRSN